MIDLGQLQINLINAIRNIKAADWSGNLDQIDVLTVVRAQFAEAMLDSKPNSIYCTAGKHIDGVAYTTYCSKVHGHKGPHSFDRLQEAPAGLSPAGLRVDPVDPVYPIVKT